jgi:transcriptional regulator with XRE-family HTH domain
VTPEEIKALRKELTCTARELAGVLAVDQATVFAWERGELFPTKQYVDRMKALRSVGPSSIPRKPRPLPRASQSALPLPGAAPLARADASNPLTKLADPKMWDVVRKLLVHEELRDEVFLLAARYSDPAAAASSSTGSAASSATGSGASATPATSASGAATEGDG